MEKPYVETFVNSTLQSLGECMDIQLTAGEPVENAVPEPFDGVVVIIGIMGDMKGRIIYSMVDETALKICEAMNYEPFDTLNDLARSTISELGNIIGGRAVSDLNDKGLKLMMSPPVMFTGKVILTSDKLTGAILIPIESNFGSIKVNLAVESVATAVS